MAAIRCDVCGGMERDDVCTCAMDDKIAALETENAELRRQLTQVTKLIGEAIEFCETCHGAEDSGCARCQSFRTWLEAQA